MSALRIAAATSDGASVDLHFGRADSLSIYDLSENGEPVLAEKRRGIAAYEGAPHDNVRRFADETLRDVDYLLVARIGPGLQRALTARGVCALELEGESIPDAAARLHRFEQKRARRFGKGV